MLLLNHIMEEFGVPLTILKPFASGFLFPEVLLHDSGFGQLNITVRDPFPIGGRGVIITSSLSQFNSLFSHIDVIKDVPKNISIPPLEMALEALQFS